MKLNVFNIAGRAMSAQLTRMNTTASNLANAKSVAGTSEKAYRALKPVFETVYGANGKATVKVLTVEETHAEPKKIFNKLHPLADKNGYIYEAAVDETTEMVEMLETSRQYQNNVQVLQTAKALILRTIRLGE